MSKFNTWFSGLSQLGKVGFIGALGVAGFIGASALAAPSSVQVEVPGDSTVQQDAKEPVLSKKTEVKTVAIPFEKKTVQTSTLAKGQTKIQTEGVNGSKRVTYTISLKDGVEIGRTSKSEVTKKPVTQVTLVGTYEAPKSNCDPNYSGCVPNVSYDLDCPDIGFTVQVLGYDKHGFDRDGDGYGCEAY